MEVKTHKLSTKDISYCNQFKLFLKNVYEYNLNKITYSQLYDNIKNDNYNYSLMLREELYKDIEKEKLNKSKINSINFDENFQQIVDAIEKFKKKNFQFQLPEIVDLDKHTHQKTYFQKSGIERLFSAGKKTGFISSFNNDDFEEIINQVITADDRTPFNLNYKESWDQLVYFIRNLTKSDIFEVDNYNFPDYIKFNPNNNVLKLEKLIEEYQLSNIKTKIPEIITLINSNPIIKEQNDIFKNETLLYRGITSEEYLTDNMIEIDDKKNKYISATKHYSVATRFAKGMGEYDTARRSSIGYVITYETTPDSIIFCTDLFGKMFGESDYIIDATKSKIKNIKQI